MIPARRSGVLAAGLATGLLGWGLGILAAAALLGAAGVGGAAGAGASSCGPSAGGDLAGVSPIAAREIPSRLLPLYRRAADDYRLGPAGWAWLAAVNRLETDFGRDLTTSSAGAVGWMQFEPATWAQYGVDGNGDGRKDPSDPADAIPAAAAYLHALGAPADWQAAIRGYNGGPANARSPATLAYWQTAARSAAAYLGPPSAPAPAPGRPSPSPPAIALLAPALATPAAAPPSDQCTSGGALPLAPGDHALIQPDGRAAAPADAPPGVRAMIAAGNELIGRPYVYGGGHSDWRLAPGYDCSSTVSFALHGGGLLDQPEDSVALEDFGAPGPGLWVTVFANPVHAFVYVAGIRLDTSPQPGDGRLQQLGPRWRPAPRGTVGFVVRHPPGL